MYDLREEGKVKKTMWGPNERRRPGPLKGDLGSGQRPLWVGGGVGVVRKEKGSGGYGVRKMGEPIS